MQTLGAVIVGAAALLSLVLWGQMKPAIDQATCRQPVHVAGQLVSCTGHAVVSLPDGTTAIITPAPTPAVARR